jgi:FixJ family two-component response regulator
VYLVDDDDSMRESLEFVLTKAGFEVHSFSSPYEFLDSFSGEDCGCLVLDLKMPGMSGLELAETLRQRGINCPFLMLTGYATVSTAVSAMRSGACDFIEKPVEHTRLIECIHSAIYQGQSIRRNDSVSMRFDLPEDLLTLRERQIMSLVVDGLLSKQIANQLGISIKTVDVHRSNSMKKLGVTTVAQLMKKVVSPLP